MTDGIFGMIEGNTIVIWKCFGDFINSWRCVHGFGKLLHLLTFIRYILIYHILAPIIKEEKVKFHKILLMSTQKLYVWIMPWLNHNIEHIKTNLINSSITFLTTLWKYENKFQTLDVLEDSHSNITIYISKYRTEKHIRDTVPECMKLLEEYLQTLPDFNVDVKQILANEDDKNIHKRVVTE